MMSFIVVFFIVIVIGMMIFIFAARALQALLGIGEPRGLARRSSGAVQVGPLPGSRRPGSTAAVAAGRTCPYELCKAPNDSAAHFCRRCGRELAPAEQVRARRMVG